MNVLIGIIRVYMWVAAIGFPIALMFALERKKALDHAYYLGMDDCPDCAKDSE